MSENVQKKRAEEIFFGKTLTPCSHREKVVKQKKKSRRKRSGQFRKEQPFLIKIKTFSIIVIKSLRKREKETPMKGVGVIK